MKSYVLVCCLVVGAVAYPHEVMHHAVGANRMCKCDAPAGNAETSADREQSHTLDELTHQLHMLQQAYDTGMGRVDDVMEDMDDLSHRIADHEKEHCKKYREFQCGGDHPKCISNLLVCDGDNDCDNGADEARCDVLTEAGSSWTGTVVYDHCTKRRPETMKLSIKSVDTVPFFTTHPKVRGTVLMEKHTKDYSEVINEPVSGYWSSADRSAAMPPDSAGHLGFVCIFHGHDHDTCTGLLTKGKVTDACAEFTFHRD
uniref:Extracellular hemoglobin linker L2 n=1 Tax=Arenicola marina TaxID=6344 RepID=Q4A1S6_AREMA|nr:extracellular hemoglobin linker L2 precursor [Arenicola marina]